MSIHGGDLIYNENPLWYEYDKYLGAFGLVLVSRNNGTIRPLFVCTKANYGSVWEQLPGTMQMKAFQLNKYENCGKVLKHFDHFQLNTVTVPATGTLNCYMNLKWKKIKLHFTFSCLFDPSIDFGKY